MNPAFNVAREIGTNLSQGFNKVRDENTIEKILTEVQATNNPELIQKSIGQILSSVSPERQPQAIAYLQSIYGNIEAKQKQKEQREAAIRGGYDPFAPPAVQAEQIKQNAKIQRLSPYGLAPQTQPVSQPNIGASATPSKNLPTGTPATPPTQQPSIPENALEKMSDSQLRQLTGHPDKEVSEVAKSILKSREEQNKIDLEKNKNWTKFGMERAKKVLDRAEEIAQTLPVKKTALKLMVDSIASKNLGFFSRDNLAEITGVEGFRSPEGALFKTAGKEYFLGNISRAGARPNQWIEQQISDMMTKVGRSTDANLSVARALQNETDIDEERVRLTDEIFNELRAEEKDVGDLGPILNKRIATFAEDKQKELFNDLRAIKAIEEKQPQKLHKVKNGTKISPYVVDALLISFGNDPEKALAEAQKLGYSIE